VARDPDASSARKAAVWRSLAQCRYFSMVGAAQARYVSETCWSGRYCGEPLAKYDDIGRTSSASRKEDSRLASMIRATLGDARSVLDVGAGTGAHEPRDLDVLAVEPSEKIGNGQLVARPLYARAPSICL
jgi:hypothetical protein